MTAPTAYAYQWKRNGTAIAGATAATYPLVTADQGDTITCTVTGSNTAGSAAVTTAATPTIGASTSPSAPKTLVNMGWGAYMSSDSDWNTNIASMESQTGRHLDLVLDYQNWPTGTAAVPTPTFLSQIGDRRILWTIQPAATNTYGTATEYVNWANLIAGDYDGELNTFATWVNNNITGTIFVRFAHEMNGMGWYEWQVGGKCGVTSGSNYAAGFNHVASVLKAASSKIKMVYAPNNGYTNFTEFYPSETDILAFDAYNYLHSGWYTHQQIFGPGSVAPGYDPYTQICACDPNKPVWISETSCQDVSAFNGYGPYSGVSKSGWVESLFNDSATYPRVAAIVWFNIQRERQWQINSSTDASNGFSSVFSGCASNTNGAVWWDTATGGIKT